MPPRFLSVSFHSGRTICLSDILRPPVDGKFYFLKSMEITNNGETEEVFHIGFEYIVQMLDVEEIRLGPRETKEVRLSALARAIATGSAGWTTLDIQAHAVRPTNVEPFQLQLKFTLAPTKLERGLLEAQAREVRNNPALQNQFLAQLLEAQVVEA